MKWITSSLAIILELLSIFLLPCAVIFFGLLSKLIPFQLLQKLFANYRENSALLWVKINHFIFRYLLNVDIQIEGAEVIRSHKNYLVIANHQSWSDILMLEEALRKRTGFSRYFIKKNLMHVPLAGWACHFLNYPYMYRFTKDHLAKHPENKGKDVAITKRACQNLRGTYFKLNNFPEGTRFTRQKQIKQRSTYQHLLNPKTSGIAYALQILHDQFDSIINLTIIYNESPNIFKLFLGRMKKVTILIEKLPITPDLIGHYDDDKEFRIHIQRYINHLWRKKDQLIEMHLKHLHL